MPSRTRRKEYPLSDPQTLSAKTAIVADALRVTRRTVVRWEGGHLPMPPYLGWALRGLTARLRKLERDRLAARDRRRLRR